MWNCVCICPISIRLRCEFVLQITLCTQGTASDTRCESSSRRHNTRACIPGAVVLVKFRQSSFRIRRIAATSARRRRLERASSGTDSSHRVGLSSRLVREYAIPKYSGVAIFSGHTGRPTTGHPYTGCVRPGNLQRRPFEFSSAQPSAEF